MQNATNTAETSATITSGVNESRFITHLKELFSTSKVVLSELMQNARRAGASKVMFDFADGNLVVTDDGCGIDDFGKLITVAESGWSEEIMAAEQPFGIGFSSVSFSAGLILVESKGKSIAFSSEDLIAKRPIAVRTSDFIGGTRITLTGFRITEKEQMECLRKFAMGFAIPVFANGEELPRPHAMAALKGSQTSVGFVHVPQIHGANEGFSMKAHLYCQGLPVDAGMITKGYDRGPEASIIHVDHLSYKPRVPDRDVLIDGDKAAGAFEEAIRLIWMAHMAEEKVNLAPVEFVERFWVAAQRLGCLSVFNDVPAVPKGVLSFQRDYPTNYDGYESSMGPYGRSLSREEVESGAVKLCYEPEEDLIGDNFARMLFARNQGYVYVGRQLPEGHWAHSHIFDLDSADFRISGEVLAEGAFDGRWCSGRVKLMKQPTLTLNGVTVELTDPVAVLPDAQGCDTVFYVPQGLDGAAQVLRQASSYRDEHEDYQELAYDIDWDDFTNLVAILSGENPEVTLTKCLREASAGSKENLRGKRFMVAFDDKGKATVEIHDADHQP